MSEAQNGPGAGNQGGQGGEGGQGGDALDPKVVNAINSVVTAQLKKRLPELVTESVGTAVKGALGEVVETLKKELKPEAPANSGGKGQPDERDKEIVQLRDQLKQVTDSQAKIVEQANANAEAAKKARIEARSKDAENAVRSGLQGKVRSEPGVVEMLVRDLMRNIKVTEEADPTMLIRKPSWVGGPDEDHDVGIADGIAHWLKQKDAEFFIPPPGNAGTNNNGKTPKGGPPAAGNAQLSDDPAVRTLQQLDQMGVKGAFSTNG